MPRAGYSSRADEPVANVRRSPRPVCSYDCERLADEKFFRSCRTFAQKVELKELTPGSGSMKRYKSDWRMGEVEEWGESRSKGGPYPSIPSGLLKRVTSLRYNSRWTRISNKAWAW